jgi:hypothetical protein
MRVLRLAAAAHLAVGDGSMMRAMVAAQPRPRDRFA